MATTKKATAKQAATKKATAKQAATKKASAKQATAKQAAKKKAATKKATTRKATTKKAPAKQAPAKKAAPKLLSGGNPQIAKGDGDGPVEAYLAALPGWKQEVGRGLDELVRRTIPGSVKAVRWNTPFYGVEGQGWFLAFHCITKYIKVSFFRGTSLVPQPPVGSKQPEVRYLHLYEGEDPSAHPLLASWIRQAAALEGTRCF